MFGRMIEGAGRVLRPALSRVSKALAAGVTGAITGGALVIHAGGGTPEGIASGAIAGFLTAFGTYLAPKNGEG